MCLLQIVVREELLDDQEYEEIKEDIMTESSTFGKVLSLVIPRPTSEDEKVPGEGKVSCVLCQLVTTFQVFVEFDSIESTTKARDALQGRRFANRTVLADYYNAKKFHSQEYE